MPLDPQTQHARNRRMIRKAAKHPEFRDLMRENEKLKARVAELEKAPAKLESGQPATLLPGDKPKANAKPKAKAKANAKPKA